MSGQAIPTHRLDVYVKGSSAPAADVHVEGVSHGDSATDSCDPRSGHVSFRGLKEDDYRITVKDDEGLRGSDRVTLKYNKDVTVDVR